MLPNDDQAWIYVNNLRLYRELLADGAAWVKDHGGTTLDYLDSDDGQQWGAFISALNGSPVNTRWVVGRAREAKRARAHPSPGRCPIARR